MPAPADGGFDAESLLRSLMENIPGAIYRAVNDSAWTVLKVSDEIEGMTGLPASEFRDGSMLISVTHPEDRERVNREIDAAIAADRPWVLEYRVVHTDGGVRWVHERGVKTVEPDGKEWLDGIMFDITERRAAEQLRVERELEALRVAELEASRARIIEAADEARRRIERDSTTARSSAWSSLRCCCAPRRTRASLTPTPRSRCARRARSSTRGWRSCARSRAASIRPC